MVDGVYLNERSSCFHHVQCSLDGLFCATGVNGDIDGIDPASFLKTEFLHHRASTTLGVFHAGLVRVSRGREKYISGCVVFRKLESRGYDVNRDDSRCAEGFCNRHTKETHGASTPHGDGLGGTEVANVGDCMDRDGKGFNLRSESAGGKVTKGD